MTSFSRVTTATLAITTVLVAGSVQIEAKPEVTVLAELQERPGNPAVAPDGTVYISMHPFDNPEYKVMRLEDGKAIPFPNENLSKGFASVIGIQVTQDGTVWILDMGNDEISPKLFGWDTNHDVLKSSIVVPQESNVANSFHQDFAIDEKRQRAFIADMSRSGMIDTSEPAIVVVDLKTGATRRVLSGDKVFQPADTPIIAEGMPMQLVDDQGTTHSIHLGLNPIAIDPENEWVYFSTMTPGSIYRVPAAIIGDFTAGESAIAEAIEVYAPKPSSDGIAVGPNGTVYITNIDDSSIDIADASGTRTWLQDERLVWPDGLYVAPDGSVVVTINQLNRAPVFSKGRPAVELPYAVIRISEN
ncbi:MAG: L-dopachrome tautomerase-related protein [Verrucomicrobiota bacterium]